MKREEKNQKTRRRILDNALKEFSEKGYKGSSVNSICSAKDISKGIIYHYFNSKDELYLECVAECFTNLTEYLKSNFSISEGKVEDKVEKYFSIRRTFFSLHPEYQSIFSEVIILPPENLKGEIAERRKDYDAFTSEILLSLLQSLDLRHGISVEDAVAVFSEYQDFINARYSQTPLSDKEFLDRDKASRKAIDVLLYGIVERRVK